MRLSPRLMVRPLPQISTLIMDPAGLMVVLVQYQQQQAPARIWLAHPLSWVKWPDQSGGAVECKWFTTCSMELRPSIFYNANTFNAGT